MSRQTSFRKWITSLQDTITEALEGEDPGACFYEDHWTREQGGGGRSRVIEKGDIFEKGGVGISTVYGELPKSLKQTFGVAQDWFHASGISLVLHPRSPMIPAVHANFRYFELRNTPDGECADAWFGGGADLTPWYLFSDDARHFHGTWKKICDRYDPELYPVFKKECDRYFFNSHRKEARGIGGIFYDYLRSEDGRTLDFWQEMTVDCGNAFLDAYLPIVQRRKREQWGDKERFFQEVRRGRYAEFNLIHDRGTLFGLKTGGRTESILMSLPPRVRWVYHVPEPEKNSMEAKLLEVLHQPVEWV